MDDPSPTFDGKGGVVWRASNGVVLSDTTTPAPSDVADPNLKALIERRAARLAESDPVEALSLRLDNIEK